ncbi:MULTISPECIES: biotin carboxylase N-terminal domain-containing protein [unclassified Cryobacterium]|uniref:acetyl/propionyl/methylcrotonyl-CoA carboxylase subunit alpha n=1 Tax=unclassified Cryobacterium TaxID=2649013 RepID=UPI00106AEDEB|nr:MULTISPECIES: biotin carboxylase N-terminal domain-containing protein [unclassified Cryobacterium]TFC56462.1 ATP-grasp domain-containing protein [Cryobacterium sp. TMB3-1-2]TFC67333.1 ATP-grasp domain-containing protein [Cryobacterium sp. TMB3-15]TFC73154.1 ATP-grasp domain-containing protein [Cryobacterium sp. TMB3-10]TFD37842.1 ATP-grasp domain-containing protein [Cryobacterium sp. TMB3-12]
MSRITKVLIANRGEIAVRVIRAAKDSGILSVAVYADQDRDALHARLADEAYGLDGTSSAETYLVIEKILSIARRSGADAVHPGYGFLAENAAFARAVLDAGLIWIGPSPEAIEQLGDKVSARHIAEKVHAPMAPGTLNPVADASEVLDFVDQYGLPVAIKAAFGGGGRGLKVARTRDEVPELFDSAVREAVTAFGRGECFVEKYLDKPRHVETQCLADAHGNVVVISTRDCSLQRRHQKLVEEAPAPFLTEAQTTEMYRASKAILREVGYVGAGTCEFLIGQDGTVSFLEVNTRLQVEHPVSEEVTGIDLVREQFRLAEGGTLDYDDPIAVGHSFEFRINGEDAGRGFMPAPGPVHVFKAAGGPGVRVDSGVQSGDEISGSFDSLLAKLIVTGATREQALERARRALDEFEVAGLPTVLPFHRMIVRDPAFAPADGAPFSIYTRWIETEFENTIAPWSGTVEDRPRSDARHSVVVEVDGRRIEVSLPSKLLPGTASEKTAGPAPRRRTAAHSVNTATGDAVKAPMQATIVKILVTEGDTVVKGDLLLVLEAMKMEQPLTAHKDGVVGVIGAAVGSTVSSGHLLMTVG